VRPRLAPADYARALAALRGPHAALETLLAGFAPAGDFPPRLPDLDADLAAIGMTPFPLSAALPAADSDAARVGCLYVVEGSNLGGTVIARQLATSLAAGIPRAFFAGSSGPPRWEGFWRFAAARCAPEGHATACAAARAAFAFYRRHLDACLQQMAAVPPAPTFA